MFVINQTKPDERGEKPRRRRFSRALTGLRFYSPRLGRWASRDPIEEEGGPNINAFVLNSPIDKLDVVGQSPALAIELIVAALDRAAGRAAAEALKNLIIQELIVLGVWACSHCNVEITDHGSDFHWWPVVVTYVPPKMKKCYYQHFQVRVSCGHIPLIREQLPYGPCYKNPNALPPTIH